MSSQTFLNNISYLKYIEKNIPNLSYILIAANYFWNDDLSPTNEANKFNYLITWLENNKIKTIEDCKNNIEKINIKPLLKIRLLREINIYLNCNNT